MRATPKSHVVVFAFFVSDRGAKTAPNLIVGQKMLAPAVRQSRASGKENEHA
jgi:hypothetical protein